MKQAIQFINGTSMVALPENLLKSLKLRPGDELYITQTDNGALMLTPYNPELANLINIYEKFSRRSAVVG